MPLRADLASLKTWGFGDPGPLRDELTAAALSGAKTTTASLDDDTPIVLEGFRIVERLDPGEAG
jgi:uncharacterized protein YhfF